MLYDVAFVSGEIQRLLDVNITLKEDNQVYNGDGTAPNLIGAYTTAPAYTAPQAGITDANIYDLVLKLQEEITRTAGAKYVPNYVLMNHSDVNKMRLWKDGQNNYIVPPFAAADGSSVAGIRIVASNTVDPNTLLIGDFNYGTLYSIGDVQVSVGWVNDQFTRNMVTILAEKREGLLIREADKTAFRKVQDIDVALVTLGTTAP
jgi:HK97 family phage major capsid protein